MTDNYSFVQDLQTQLPDIPSDSIISRTFYQDDRFKSILFGFAAGQELSEHTASVPAVIHILSGEARLTLGTDAFDVQAGSWARMPAGLAHSVYAKSPVKMLLLMFKEDGS